MLRKQELIRSCTPIIVAAVLSVPELLVGGPPDAGQNVRPPGGLTETSKSPFVRMRAVGLADARWTDGLWAQRLEICRTNTLPAMWRIMDGTNRSQFLHNFRIAAGKSTGRHRGPAWNDGDCYKWLEAAAAVYAISRDVELRRHIDEAVRDIVPAQRSDGYLHTPVLIANRNGDDSAQPFQDRLNFEMYNFGHLMTAACVHHRATGKSELLDVAIKAADFLERKFRDPTAELARNSVCPSHYMGTVELYRETGDERYLQLAKSLIAMRDLVADGTDDNQDRLPFRQQTQAVGHAVRANYLYAGVADLVAETGDQSLLAPLRKISEDVLLRKMYVTGACGALYDGASPEGAKNQQQISRTHQAYGRDYQLPNSTAHNETCASIGNAMWNWRMLQITGEARFADVLELVLLNGVLAGGSLDGKDFFYTNTLRQLDQMPVPLRWSRLRQPFISCFCCPPNLARTIAEAQNYAYGLSDDTVWLNLYGASSLDTRLAGGDRIRLRQQTKYPWDGHVQITVQSAPSRPIALACRIPGWAQGAKLKVSGAETLSPEPGIYAVVQRMWLPGDTLELELPMRPRLIEAHPLVEEARNQVAIQRGPIVYCLESTDLAPGLKVSEIVIPTSTNWQPRFELDLLGGVTVLTGTAQAIVDRAWTNQLYRELNASTLRDVSLKLIPYFAWSNRGPSEMTVWLPVRR